MKIARAASLAVVIAIALHPDRERRGQLLREPADIDGGEHDGHAGRAGAGRWLQDAWRRRERAERVALLGSCRRSVASPRR